MGATASEPLDLAGETVAIDAPSAQIGVDLFEGETELRQRHGFAADIRQCRVATSNAQPGPALRFDVDRRNGRGDDRGVARGRIGCTRRQRDLRGAPRRDGQGGENIPTEVLRIRKGQPVPAIVLGHRRDLGDAPGNWEGA